MFNTSKMHMPINSLLSCGRKFLISSLMAFSFFHSFSAYGSGYEPPSSCDMEWFCRTFVRARSPEHRQRQVALAEAGNVDSQFFLGIVTQERTEKERWLKMAIANGSKAAAAYYGSEAQWTDDSGGGVYFEERWYTKPMTPELHAELLAPIVAAAEDGDPLAATWLVIRGRGQYNHCPITIQNCPRSPLFTRENVHHWAEIAARGGNMGAAEYLCNVWEVSDGLPRDNDKAYYWCSIAAAQSCANSAKIALGVLYKDKRVPAYAQPAPDGYWIHKGSELLDQIHRGNSSLNVGYCN